MNGPLDPLRWALGWTLLHSLWECALLGLGVALGLRLMAASPSRARYRFALAGLFLMGLSSLVTFGLLYEGAGRGGTGLRSWQAELTPWLPLLGTAWSLGAAFMGLRLVWGLGRLYGSSRWGTQAPDPEWEARLQRLVRRLGLAVAVRLRVATWADSPMVMGCLRPVLLVPPAAFLALAPEALEAVLIHELAHVLRRDFLVNLLQSGVEALLFHHPALWWVSAQVRLEREHCCDDYAAALSGDRLDYAQALLELERLRGGALHPGLAPAAGGKSLMARIRRLLQPQRPVALLAPLGPWAALLLLLASSGLALAGSRLPAPELSTRLRRDEAAPLFILAPDPQGPAAQALPAQTPSAAPIPPHPRPRPVDPPEAPPQAVPPTLSLSLDPIPTPIRKTYEAAPEANVPKAWLKLPVKWVPIQARFDTWSGELMAWVERRVEAPPALEMEVPPGGAFRAQLKVAWDSPIQLAVSQDAAWKLGLRFSRDDQRFRNRKPEVQVARVSLTQTWAQDVNVLGRDGGVGDHHVASGPWPYEVRFTRDWDLEAWRTARRRGAPAPEGLPELEPVQLEPRFVPALPGLPSDPEARGLAEVMLVLDAEGRPWAVHPGLGHPELLRRISDWAWQLAFMAPKPGAVKVPLRVRFGP